MEGVRTTDVLVVLGQLWMSFVVFETTSRIASTMNSHFRRSRFQIGVQIYAQRRRSLIPMRL